MITRVPAKGHEQASTSQGEPNASNEESSFKLFSESDIMIATNNLSKKSTIGRGGFGNVYKGTIVNTEVAIKILDTQGTQGANEFIQEMAVLKNLKHENLVKLMGACLELRALVYEFLPRGSLEDCLNNSSQLLTWQIRTRIVYEICSILMFLHSMKPKPLVHGDLKPQNILLDADLHCRLSDFGLCRILSEFSESTGAYLHTKSINGTECYMDPDYVEHGKVTPGCDVFSFGVTILRILTGQRPLNIRRKIRKASRSNSLMTIVDSTAGDWPVEVAEYLAKSGLDCCKENRNNLKLMTELSTFIENLAEKGLMSCRKSCRLRWLNYLRPNINHGEFSDVCSLDATIGSRWSIMAAQLPGRTDNDIKNYWNTKPKKKLLGSAPFQKKPSQHQHQQQQLFFPSKSPPLPSFPLDLFSRLRIQSPPPVNQQYQISFGGGNEKSRSSSDISFGNKDQQLEHCDHMGFNDQSYITTDLHGAAAAAGGGSLGQDWGSSTSEFAPFGYSLEEIEVVEEIVEEVVEQLITSNITTTTTSAVDKMMYY